MSVRAITSKVALADGCGAKRARQSIRFAEIGGTDPRRVCFALSL